MPRQNSVLLENNLWEIVTFSTQSTGWTEWILEDIYRVGFSLERGDDIGQPGFNLFIVLVYVWSWKYDKPVISETSVPVSRPRLTKSKSQHWDRDYESCSLSFKTKTQNIGLIIETDTETETECK